MHRRRPLSFLVVVVLALTGLTTTAASAQDRSSTDFGFRGSGYASLVTTGTLSGQVGRTAQSSLPCTRFTGVQRSNSVASVDLGSLIEVGAATTTNESVEMPNGTLHSVTTSEIAGVTIGTALTNVEIEGLEVVARAWWDGDEFQKRKWTNIADVSLVVAGISVPLSVGSLLSEGVDLPGIATIKTGTQQQFEDANGTWIKATGLHVELLGSATVNIGRAWAAIENLEADPFAGQAFALRADALGGAASVGPIARQPIACAGTDGQWRETTTPSVNAGIVEASTISSRVFAHPWSNFDFSVARGESDVASLSVLDGLVEVEGLHTQAYLKKKPNGTYVRSANGTTFASLTVDGQHILPEDFVNGELTIPGVAHLELARFQGKQQGINHGVVVTGLVIELLGGNAATVEVGKVRLVIK